MTGGATARTSTGDQSGSAARTVGRSRRRHTLRLIAVNALEAIAVDAARAESWPEHARLLAAAQRLRDETGYRWRYRYERDLVDHASAAARAALGDQPALPPGESSSSSPTATPTRRSPKGC